MIRPGDATHGDRTGNYYKADPLEALNWLKWIGTMWVNVGTLSVGTIKPLCDVLDYAPPPPPPMPDLPPAPVAIPQSIFNGFGSNWKWASVDYRGVARVHTFEPHFTPTGRIEMPRFKANSEPREAMNMTVVPEGWTPLKMPRAVSPPYTTDRFGVQLPTGADPVEAADVAPVESAPTVKKYSITTKTISVETGEFSFTPEQVLEILRQALVAEHPQLRGMDMEPKYPMKFGHTLIWERVL